MDKTFRNEYGQFTFNVDSNPRMASVFEREGHNQRDAIEIIRKHVKPGHTVLDIGAHIGSMTIPLAQMAEFGYVCAFEPFHESASYLRRNIADNQITNVRVYEVALGAKRGRISMSGGKNAASFDVTEGGDIPMETLDTMRFERPIDFIKMDVEGLEPEVLEGGRALLRLQRPIVFFEVNLPQLRKHGTAPLQRLEKALPGYKFFVDGKHYKNLWRAALAIEPKYFLIGRGSGTTFDVLALPVSK
jgi:FkbM family methyltransferase